MNRTIFEHFYQWKTDKTVEHEVPYVKQFLEEVFEDKYGIGRDGSIFVEKYNAWYRKNKQIKN